MKTDFKLSMGDGDKGAGHSAELNIIGAIKDSHPYVAIYVRLSESTTQGTFWVEDKDLERLARNILKALGKNQ